MIRLCIFDLDGTTVNSLKSIAHFANETLKEFGLKTFEVDEYRHLAGGGAKKLIANLINENKADIALLDDMVSDWLSRYEKNAFYLTEPYEGINDMLKQLKDMGIKTAIVTNKSERVASSIIKGAFGELGDLIDIAISEHPGMVLKPEPDELLNVGKIYGIPMSETMYIGDHGIDMQTGKNAGAYACGVTWGFHTKEHLLDEGADFIAETPNELIDIINKINKEKSK
jgi:phosphoglycolate phosphatase